MRVRVFHYSKGNAAKGKNKEKAKPKPEASVKFKAKIKAKQTEAKATKCQKSNSVKASMKAEQSEQIVASAVTAKERLLHLLSVHAEAENARVAAKAGAAEPAINAENIVNEESESNEAKAASVGDTEYRSAKTSKGSATETNADANNDSATRDTCDSESALFYPVVVYTPQDLEAAQAAHAEHIVVKGDMAKKLRIALKSLRSLSVSALNALALCMSGAALFAPFTGGVSLGAAGTVMGTVGAALTATAIAAISAIGLSLVLAVLRGYDEIKLAGGGLELHLQKKKAKTSEKISEQTTTLESASVNTSTMASSAV